MKIIISILAFAVAAGAHAFDMHVTAQHTGDNWTYTVHNDEQGGSSKRPHALYITLDTSVDITNMASPPGWDFETDYRTYIVWSFLENQPVSVTPAAGGSLGGFSFTAPGALGGVQPLYVGSYDSDTMTESEDAFGATTGPVAAPGGLVTGHFTLDSFDQRGEAFPVPFEFREPGTNTLVSLALGFVSPDGTYSVRSPDSPGTYDMICQPRTFLRKVQNVTTTASGLAGVDAVLINGDMDGDNEIAIGDFAILSSAYGSAIGDPNWFEYADLNNDESVDIADYAVLSQNYGEEGD